MPTRTAPTRYRLDENDRIAWVGESWPAFARRNGAHELAETDLRGRVLWDFVAGLETRHLYQILFETLRREQRPAALPFRCDSPELRRYMELRVEALPDGSLDLHASLLRQEPRPPVALLDARAPRSTETLAICSFCKRLPHADAWLEVEHAVTALDLFGDDPLPRLSHGVCPDCESRASALVTARREPS